MTARPSVYASDHSASGVSAHRWRTVDNSLAFLIPTLEALALKLSPSLQSQRQIRVLDIGCGPGTITVDVASRLPGAHVTGVEYTAEPLADARQLAASQHVANVVFEVADAHALPYEDDTFDLVYVHQVLQHVADPVKVLLEMRRVCRSAGVVAARESAEMTWWPKLEGLDRWRECYLAVGKAMGSRPDPGSHIHVWAREAGFARERIMCSAGAWCYAEKVEREWWGGLWIERAKGGAFAKNALAKKVAIEEEMAVIADAWSEWSKNADGWFSVIHGEIICTKD